jgi:tRNA threonylcarbamoyladenosine biosynthesis protein TsaB
MSETVLAIDTGAPRLQLALLRAGSVDTLIEDMAQGQAERLMPAIGDLLGRNALRYADLTRIAVTTGPGSFTGLRIGLSAARGLGLALNVPVVGVPTLLALSLGAAGPLAVLMDARRGEAYVQRFSAPGLAETEPCITPMDNALAIAGALRVEPGPFCDIGLVARFAAAADPGTFPPEALYVRGADAKPQDRFRVARREET